ncbi:orotate phosphoribosyltransferase [Calorimonas adulescens]|uniref:orotate phosphoribosyltransferase n=1 Tax=Calorimonas adulescens TaxID=2606906 RepID=UPI001EF05F25|nr:orotate phosphoribosyltransferase [Calorimonas adulescens]
MDILEILRKTEALLEGHFLLTSGKHSDRYIQCAKITQYPEYCEEICKAMAKNFQDEGVDVVIGPAIGGILESYEVARQLKAKSIFAERENRILTLRRGFEIKEGERVLVVEDVTTTGGTTREVIDLVRSHGGIVVGVTSIVDRSGGKIDFGVTFKPLVIVDFNTYNPDECLLCKRGIPYIKPGSRKILS